MVPAVAASFVRPAVRVAVAVAALAAGAGACASVADLPAPDAGEAVSILPRPTEPAPEPVRVTMDVGAPPYRGITAGGRLWVAGADRAVAIDPSSPVAGCDETACVDEPVGALAELYGRAWTIDRSGSLAWWDPAARGRQELTATGLTGRGPVSAAGRVWVLDTSAGVVRSTDGPSGDEAGAAIEVPLGAHDTALLAGDGDVLWVVRTTEAAAVAVDPIRRVAGAERDLGGGDPAVSAQWPTVRHGILHVVVAGPDSALLTAVAPGGTVTSVPVPPIDASIDAVGDAIVLTVGGFAALEADRAFDHAGIHPIGPPARLLGRRLDVLDAIGGPSSEPPRPLGDGWFLADDGTLRGRLLRIGGDTGTIEEHLVVGRGSAAADIVAAGTFEARPWVLVAADGPGAAELWWYR